MSHLEEFNKQKKAAESVFNELFNFGKKQEPQGGLFFEKNGVYYFNNGQSSAQKISGGDAVSLKHLDFQKSKLNFLVFPDTEFHAKTIGFDLNKQIVTHFHGEWVSGGFVGVEFFGVFNGSSFLGGFAGDNENYKSDPTSFVNGTFFHSNNGILGLPNTITFSTSQPFELVSVPVGYTIQFRTKNGIDSHITILKRLDKNDSQFHFEVLNGFTRETKDLVVEWTTIRNNWNTGFYKISLASKNIADLIEIPSGDEIVEMYISQSKASFKSPAAVPEQQFVPKKKYQFDLKTIPFLNIKQLRGNSNTLVNLSFESDSEFNEYEKALKDIGSGQFAQDLKNINRAIRYGEVDGFGPHIYLKNIFNGVQGKNSMNLKEIKKHTTSNSMFGNINNKNIPAYKAGIASKTQPVTQKQKIDPNSIGQSMLRVNNFVKFFVDNIVSKLGKPHLGAKKIILDRLKETLGTSVFSAPVAPAPAAQSITPVAPGPGTPGPGTGVSSTITGGLKGLKESIRSIINDHF